MSCPRASGLTDLYRKCKDPFERTAAVSAFAVIEIGSLVGIARLEAQNVAADNAAAPAAL